MAPSILPAVLFHMPLRTVRKGPLEGRVCYATLEGSRRFVTVEVATEQCAYRFLDRLDTPLKEGEWVRFEGDARVQITSKKDEPEELERIRYYHQPYDGSDVRDWTYYDLNGADCVRIGPLDVISALQSAIQRSKVHVDDWFGSCSTRELLGTRAALSAALDALSAELDGRGSEDDVRVVAPDIDV